FSHHFLAEPINRALSGERHQRHFAGLAGLEPRGRAGCDVEPHSAGLLAVELERRIDLEEMIVAADLDRPIPRIGDGERYSLAAPVEFDLAGPGDDFAGDHGCLILSARAR